MADYYEVLGISRTADDKGIRQAFRRLARKYHPDLNPGDENAEERFKEINEAHGVLSDPEARKKYDTYGSRWKNADQFEARGPFTYGGGGAADFGADVFSGFEDILGRSRSRRASWTSTASRLETPVTVSLEDAYYGSVHNVTISSGIGQRRVEVTVPPGVDTGSKVRFKLDRDTEILLKVTVTPHERFERKGADLYMEAQVPFEDVVLGGETRVETLTGRLHVKVPAGTQNGQRIRLARQGMPKLKSPKERGDLFVTVRPVMPKELTDDERGLLEEFRRLRPGSE